jgi:hypothetical protein
MAYKRKPTSSKRDKNSIPWIDDLVKWGAGRFFSEIKDYMIGNSHPANDETMKALAKAFLTARSSVEQKWAYSGKLHVSLFFESQVVFGGYEWFSFKLPGGEYTPDWCYLLKDGRWVMVELKGSQFQPNYRDARSKLRAAATLNPWFTFVEARPARGATWEIEIIKADELYMSVLVDIEADEKPNYGEN